MKGRADWIDYAKAIGIILVVYGHVARGLFNSGIPLNPTLYEYADSVIYSFHMPLFFLLSGLLFVQSHKRRGGIGVMSSKLDTVVYPYLIWGTFQGLLIQIMGQGGYANNHLTVLQVFEFWKPLGQFWFLYDLFFCFFLSCVLYRFASYQLHWLFLMFAAIAYVYQEWCIEHLILGVLSRDLVFFFLGISLSLINISRLDSHAWFGIFIFLFAVLQYFFHFTLDMRWLDRGALSLVLATISIMFIIGCSFILARHKSQVLLLLGRQSMAIYLLHVIFASTARIVLQKIFHVDNFALHFTAGLVLGLGGPVLIAIIVEKYKIDYVFTAPLSRLFSARGG